MNPEYFMHRLTLSEAIDYIKGQDRRCRQHWERTRFLAGTIYKVLTGEELELQFAWEQEPEKSEDEMSEEEKEWGQSSGRQKNTINARSNGCYRRILGSRFRSKCSLEDSLHVA